MRLIELKSGKKSFWYANFRKTIQSYQKLAKLTCILADFIEHNLKLSGLDAVIGVPEGSSILGYELQKELVCRKHSKIKFFNSALNLKLMEITIIVIGSMETNLKRCYY